MKMILKYLEELKKECVLAPLFKMLEALQCQGGSWLCYRNKACFIQAYTVTFVHGDGRHWNVNSYDKNDK